MSWSPGVCSSIGLSSEEYLDAKDMKVDTREWRLEKKISVRMRRWSGADLMYVAWMDGVDRDFIQR